jgi:hypothetical protein
MKFGFYRRLFYHEASDCFIETIKKEEIEELGNVVDIDDVTGIEKFEEAFYQFKRRKEMRDREERFRGKDRDEKEERDSSKSRDRDSEALRKQTEETAERPEYSRASIFDPDIDFQEWVCKIQDDAHIIDIIPYYASERHPQLPPNGRVQVDKLIHSAEYFVHKRIGPMNLPVICLNETFPGSKFACPICEKRTELADDLGWKNKIVEGLKPKHFALYNIIVLDDGKEERKGIQVWSIQWGWFGRELKIRSKKPKEGGYIYYADPDIGKQIMFYHKGTVQAQEYTGHSFEPRDYKISQKDIDNAYVLEDLVPIPTYEEVEDLFKDTNLEKFEKGWGEASPSKDKGRDRDEDYERDKGKDKRDRDEEDQGKDKRDRGRDREEDMKIECKYKGEFGVDIDNLDECADKCKIYDECSAEADRIEREQRKEKKNSRDRDRDRDRDKEEKEERSSKSRRGEREDRDDRDEDPPPRKGKLNRERG